ncbi:hypothetical protein [Arachidicoccus terrestris]|uniref:hypothetical protein n=1 Tax=Arachidicoccus terrestris TaxID=2875539 RepID=UPI001CC39A18|nr:hypothetical protein [Arachidicoccus terrestris]UAY55770.1 hypothetical protein K9M52_01670 [Arachidicoccus terrestris]
MKKVWVILICVATIGGLRAQTFSELFKQKKTQEKYLVRQIAELQSYIALAGKGYGIVTDGLQFIGDLKNRRFNLDKDYFSSLENISPTVRSDEDITSTITRYNDIRALRERSKKVGQSHYLHASEKEYIEKVWANLFSKCKEDMNQLEALTTPGKYRMKESERIDAIHKIYQGMQDKYDFACQFYNEASMLIIQRMREKADVGTLRNLYDIEP